jgi:single-stranded DNA-binding protein
MIHPATIADNDATLTGKVFSEPRFSHTIYGEGFYNFDVEVERLSTVMDILPVTVSERIIDRAELKPGVPVRIDGQLRSYNTYVEKERRNRLILTIFARDIHILTEQAEAEEPEGERRVPNEVFLNGYICKPAIYRKTPFGREIADILIAVNRSYNKSDYIPCIAWGRNARFAGKLAVGDNIRLWGRMQSRKYQKKLEDGQVLEKVAYEVSVSKVECDAKSSAQEDMAAGAPESGGAD